MSLLIVSILASKFDENREFFFNAEVDELLRLTDASQMLDLNSLWLTSRSGRDLLATHYHHLFTGPRKSQEICPDDDKYAQVALRILEYLCDRPPRPIPYRKRQTPKTHSHHTGALAVANRPSHSLPSHDIVRRMRLTDSGFLRKQRAEKHRHGVALSIPDIHGPEGYYRCSPTNHTHTLGLLLLPDILARSSYSSELVNFMQRHGKDIAFMPKWTRKAIRAMHEYLVRTDEDADMVELRDKFAAMVIE